MVRRLVQEHHIRALQEELREHHPRLLPSGEGGGLALEVGRREPKPAEDLLDAVVDGVSVLVLKPVVQLGVTSRGDVALGVVLRFRHLARGFLEFLLKVEQRREPRTRDRHQGLVPREVGLLLQETNADRGADVKTAVVGLFNPRQQLHQGGLARSVGADQPDPLAGAHFKAEVLEDRIAGVLPAKAGCGTENHERSSRAWIIAKEILDRSLVTLTQSPLFPKHMMIMLREAVGFITRVL